jgi:N-acetyl sugar amidotransferase
MSNTKVFWCNNCVMPSTRPRLTFDKNGKCSACQWSEFKKTNIDWDKRWSELLSLLESQKKSSNFNILVPCSGGKDGSYVNYKMKHELGMHPLALTISIPEPFEVGEQNLKNFINSGYDHILVSPNPEIMKRISKIAFINQGMPLFGWQICLQTAIPKVAINFGIPLIMYGEDGEVEYGGSTETRSKMAYDKNYAQRIYLSGHPLDFYLSDFSENDKYWFTFPSEEEYNSIDLQSAHWSYFEDWDPYSHYLLAKEKCGLQEREDASVGTYNNFAQTDTCLIDLHYYLMFLKFGFGRCSQDVGIDVRRGAMNRKQGIELVKIYDDNYPEPYIDTYLKYFDMSLSDFEQTLDKFANKDLFVKKNGRWVRNFGIV